MAGDSRVHAIMKVKTPERTRMIVFDTQDLSMGRAPENDLCIEEAEMSRRHAGFQKTPEGCRVFDLNTSNGTWVDGERIDERILRHGSKVVVGSVEITYAETTRNPASLGTNLEYASQLKGFGGALAQGDGESTILGIAVDDLGDDDEEEFEVRPAGEFDFGLHEEGGAAEPARDLDAELSDLGTGDPVDLDFDTAPPAAGDTDSAAADIDSDEWVLEDVVAEPVSASPDASAQPAARAARPAQPAAAAAARSAQPTASKPLRLSLRIDGLEGELRATLEGLIGKVLELPNLRVKIEGDDLG